MQSHFSCSQTKRKKSIIRGISKKKFIIPRLSATVWVNYNNCVLILVDNLNTIYTILYTV